MRGTVGVRQCESVTAFKRGNMTINLPSFGMAKSVWPKVFGGLGIAASIISTNYYTNPTYTILGLTAFSFYAMLGQVFNSLALFTVRQDNLSSEQAEAGNVPLVKDGENIAAKIAAKSAELAELQKKLETK